MSSPLISAAEIPSDALLLDVTYRLAGPPGREDYDAGHIPGAVFVDIETTICGEPGEGGRHPLAEPEVIQAALRQAGVRNGQSVVVYDGGDGLAAARMWWTLRWAGHRDVRVLDGGMRAWKGEVTTEVPTVQPGDLTVDPGHMTVLDATAAGELAQTGVLVDARAPERFRGEVEPIDPVAGHIPGASNLPYATLVNADGTIKTGIELPKVDGAYCGSGITAAHTVLALEANGQPGVALYVGSWSDWIRQPGSARASRSQGAARRELPEVRSECGQ